MFGREGHVAIHHPAKAASFTTFPDPVPPSSPAFPQNRTNKVDEPTRHLVSNRGTIPPSPRESPLFHIPGKLLREKSG